MVLILLEAFGAMLILVLIVWWTMFSGRKNGEPRAAASETGASDEDASAPNQQDPPTR